MIIGPEYRQTVIKSEKAAGRLTWLSSRVLESSEIAGYRQIVAEEEAEFQKSFAQVMESL